MHARFVAIAAAGPKAAGRPPRHSAPWVLGLSERGVSSVSNCKGEGTGVGANP